MPSTPHPPMLARGADPAAAGLQRARSVAGDEPHVPSELAPDAAVRSILAFLAEDRYLPARRLASEAMARFPDHAGLRKLWRIFDNRGKAAVRPGSGVSRREEFQWLRNPPAWARGKWVALVGAEAVAVADTLAEVAERVRARQFPKRPLVHHID